MQEKVMYWIDRQRLLASGDIILAACSGGADSLTLVHLLHQLRSIYGYTLVVAHVNHMLRGAEAAADARFVATFCQGLGLICYQTEVDVAGFIKSSGYSPEDAARILRYRYLRKLAVELGHAKIATGHHRDDQAETVLINLLRGSGSKGLRGIPVGDDAGEIIRPLLAVSRSDIEEYCLRHEIHPRIDSTNLSTDYLRNQVRLELLPLLERTYNPAIKNTLWRTAAILNAQDDFMQKSAATFLSSQIESMGEYLIIRVKGLQNIHLALQRECIRLAIQKKQGHLKGISFYHVEKLIDLVMRGTVGKMLLLPGGMMVRRGYETLELGPVATRQHSMRGSLAVELKVPGCSESKELGIAISAEQVDCFQQQNVTSVALFDSLALYPPLYMRTRCPGDRFWPLGAPGSKKLKDFFIDQKVPLSARDSIPLICDCRGILWVGGYRQGERGKVTVGTKKILKLTIVSLSKGSDGIITPSNQRLTYIKEEDTIRG